MIRVNLVRDDRMRIRDGGNDIKMFQQRKRVWLKKWEESWGNKNVKGMIAGRILIQNLENWAVPF